MPWHGNYKVQHHSRVNDGSSSDLNQLLATHPGWLLSLSAFNLSSISPAHLFLYDTTAAVTTASTPVWQGIIPFSITGAGTTVALGAGLVLNMSEGFALDNGLAYAISSGTVSSAISTYPVGLVKVNLQYVTSSCL